MGTVSTLAILAAGAGVIGGMAWAMLPRREDAFELSMTELATLTSGSDRWSPDDPESGGRDSHSSQDGAPVRSVDASPDHVGHGDLETGPAAGVHSGGRASLRLVK